MAVQHLFNDDDLRCHGSKFFLKPLFFLELRCETAQTINHLGDWRRQLLVFRQRREEVCNGTTDRQQATGAGPRMIRGIRRQRGSLPCVSPTLGLDPEPTAISAEVKNSAPPGVCLSGTVRLRPCSSYRVRIRT